MPQIDLKNLGWSDFFEKSMEPLTAQGFQAGRVIIEHRDCFTVLTENIELTAEVAGRLLFTKNSTADLPKVGDWVALQIFDGGGNAIIHEVLPRKTKFSRQAAGKKVDEQVIATNIDVVFVVQGLDDNFNMRRLERTLIPVNESGAKPIIILNKSDLCEDIESKVLEAEETAKGAKVLALSAKDDTGLTALKDCIKGGETFAFVGSSGVGKSTLINKIVGEDILKTNEVREGDSRGRHTTTRRELIVLPEGGCLIDTPGMREIQLWQADEGLNETFSDIDELAEGCYFSDCTHTREKKCAVLAAVESGDILASRHESYMKLQKELKFLDTKKSTYEQRKKDKELGKLYKRIQNENKKKKKR